MPTLAPTTSPPTWAPTTSAPTSPFVVPEGLFEVAIEIRHDIFPAETAWVLSSFSTGEVIKNQEFNEVTEYNAHVVQRVAVASGRYVFHIFDNYGDGIYSDGSVEIKVNGETIFSRMNGYYFEFEDTFVFVVGGVTLSLLAQHESAPGETMVQLSNFATKDTFARFVSTRSEEGSISQQVLVTEDDNLALIVADTGNAGMAGGYVALYMCTEATQEPLLFVAGDSFKDGFVETFTVAELLESSRSSKAKGGGGKGSGRSVSTAAPEHRRARGLARGLRPVDLPELNVCEGGGVIGDFGPSAKGGKSGKMKGMKRDKRKRNWQENGAN